MLLESVGFDIGTKNCAEAGSLRVSMARPRAAPKARRWRRRICIRRRGSHASAGRGSVPVARVLGGSCSCARGSCSTLGATGMTSSRSRPTLPMAPYVLTRCSRSNDAFIRCAGESMFMTGSTLSSMMTAASRYDAKRAVLGRVASSAPPPRARAGLLIRSRLPSPPTSRARPRRRDRWAASFGEGLPAGLRLKDPGTPLPVGGRAR